MAGYRVPNALSLDVVFVRRRGAKLPPELEGSLSPLCVIEQRLRWPVPWADRRGAAALRLVRGDWALLAGTVCLPGRKPDNRYGGHRSTLRTMHGGSPKHAPVVRQAADSAP